ncbi:betaRE-NMUR-3 protein [Chryseobacterium sp. StRB126]|nr:betaRE-NMUR-3 protein [Chryseobacterium sp. StRB126]
MKNVGSEYTINIIKACGINFQSDNIFAWKENKLLKLDYYDEHLSGYLLYIITFTLQFVYVIFYLLIREFKKEDIRRLTFFFFACLLGTIPLFLIAIDFGRWLYNLFIFWSLLIISLLPDAEAKTFVFDYKTIFSKKNISFIVLVFLSNFIYRVPSYFIGIEIAAPLRRVMIWCGYS